ncbi:hypothetical protein [Bacteroides heparinolyticus]|uniref:hypothetical protein n=1 Tax=Prevotella heparinolytica TaxID=28113 RepID=UPI003FA105E1
MKIQLFLSLFSFRRFGILSDAGRRAGGCRDCLSGMAAVVLPATYLSSADGTSAPFGFPPVSEEPLKEEVCFYMLCFVYQMPLQQAFGT